MWSDEWPNAPRKLTSFVQSEKSLPISLCGRATTPLADKIECQVDLEKARRYVTKNLKTHFKEIASVQSHSNTFFSFHHYPPPSSSPLHFNFASLIENPS